MSFQLADDLLDIVSEEESSGKLPGTDLREGVRTLPVLLALEADGEASELAQLIAGPDEGNVDRALKLLRAHPAMGIARDSARLEAVKAKGSLAELDPDAAHATALDGLAYLADYAADRAG
jgi:heptaprenyl diphosphate synthase